MPAGQVPEKAASLDSINEPTETMHITEYDNVDPLGALNLALLVRDPPFTPEYAARVRRTDPRPFPFLALCAVENGAVTGQVSVFRLPLISTVGREDVGGIWALSIHPEYAGRDLISRLLDEAHRRMREAGVRFSMLNTNRLQADYGRYRGHDYVDMRVWGTALAHWETAHLPTRLQARPAGAEGYQLMERLFESVAATYLGFARRHMPSARLRDAVRVDDIWIIWLNQQPIGYALVRKNGPVLDIHDLLLPYDIDVTEAAAALVAEMRTIYVQLTVSRRVVMSQLRGAGWQVAYPNWSAFMVKPLLPEVTVCDARRLFGIGTDRFLISWLDVT
jgi:GNAT superfamily N-acetyltransferase